MFGQEILYLGVAGLDTPIWDVLAPQGEQERVLNGLTMCSRSPAFPIRLAVPVELAWARFCWWAHWARLFILKKLYLSSSNLLKHSTLFLMPLGRREWVDAHGCVWMWFHIKIVRNKYIPQGAYPSLGLWLIT
jgi:hypothetical protein